MFRQINKQHNLPSDLQQRKRKICTPFLYTHFVLLIFCPMNLSRRAIQNDMVRVGQQQEGFISPLWQCPIEILVEIFKRMPVSTVDRCRQVCRFFKIVIENNPSIWKNLDLSGHTFKDYLTCIRFNNYASGKVSCLCVDNAESLRTVANMNNGGQPLCLGKVSTKNKPEDHRKKMQQIRLMINIFFVCLDISYSSKLAIPVLCKTICRSPLNGCLHTLVMSGSKIPIQNIIVAACHCRALKIVRLDHCTFTGEFSENTIDGNMLQITMDSVGDKSLQALATQRLVRTYIQELDISHVKGATVYMVIWILYRCPELQSLTAYGCKVTLLAMMRACFTYCAVLKSFTYSPAKDVYLMDYSLAHASPFSTLSTVTANTTTSWHARPSVLRKVIVRNQFIQRHVFNYLLDQCHKTLEELEISSCQTLRDPTVADLAKYECPRLHTINFKNCEQVTRETVLCTTRTACPALVNLLL